MTPEVPAVGRVIDLVVAAMGVVSGRGALALPDLALRLVGGGARRLGRGQSTREEHGHHRAPGPAQLPGLGVGLTEHPARVVEGREDTGAHHGDPEEILLRVLHPPREHPTGSICQNGHSLSCFELAPHVSRATGSQRETSRAAPGTQAARCQAGTPRGAPRGEQAQIGEDTHVSAYPRIRVYAVSRIRGYADTCIRGAARVRGYVIGLTQRIRCGYAPAFTSLYVWRQHQ